MSLLLVDFIIVVVSNKELPGQDGGIDMFCSAVKVAGA